MTLHEWAKSHNIDISYSPEPYKARLWDGVWDGGGRHYYLIALAVDGKFIEHIESGSPSPMYSFDTDRVYSDVLYYLNYFTEYCSRGVWETSSDKDTQRWIDLTRKFCEAIGEEAANEFINDWIDFED